MTPLRVRCRRSAGGYGSSSPKPVAGQLGMHSHGGQSETYTLATLKSSYPWHPDLLPPLYEPVLITISAIGLLLRDFESIDGASYVQEWRWQIE